MEKELNCASKQALNNNLKSAHVSPLFATPKSSRSLVSSAFTIVELLIVIVIIGILAAITIVSYTGITKKANEATIQAELSNATKKLAIYYAQYSSYPTSLNIADTSACPTSPNTDDSTCLKYSSGTAVEYSGSQTTYTIKFTKNSISFQATEGSSAAAVDPDWITIGTQTWAKKNLNVGTMVTGATAQTNNGTVEKYCYNNDESNCITYGALYQWNEAMRYSTTEGAQGICPAGSHIPTDAEWKTLEMQLGMTQAQVDTAYVFRGTDQGTKLKPGGSSGLNVPFAGYLGIDSLFNYLSSDAFLWSSSEASATSAWYRELITSETNVAMNSNIKTTGFSIRCLKN